MSGLSYAFSQLAALLVIAAILGVVAGIVIARWRMSAVSASSTLPSVLTPPSLDTMANLRARLTAAEGTVESLTNELRSFRDSKEVEFGRFESGAIRALDTTIAANRAREADLEQRLEEAKTVNRKGEEDLHVVERRVHSLEQALAERDQLLTELQERMEGLGR